MQSASVEQYFPTPSEFPGAPTGTHPPLSRTLPPSFDPESDPVVLPSVPPPPSVPVLPPVLLELLQATAPVINADATNAMATICFCMPVP